MLYDAKLCKLWSEGQSFSLLVLYTGTCKSLCELCQGCIKLNLRRALAAQHRSGGSFHVRETTTLEEWPGA